MTVLAHLRRGAAKRSDPVTYQSLYLSRLVERAVLDLSVDALPDGEKWRRRCGEPRIRLDPENEYRLYMTLLQDSQVCQSKDWTKWRWDCIESLLTGPLRTVRRFEEADGAKFLKRMLFFLTPHNLQFSEQSLADDLTAQVVRCACLLFETLCLSDEGMRLFRASICFQQILALFTELARACLLSASGSHPPQTRLTGSAILAASNPHILSSTTSMPGVSLSTSSTVAMTAAALHVSGSMPVLTSAPVLQHPPHPSQPGAMSSDMSASAPWLPGADNPASIPVASVAVEDHVSSGQDPFLNRHRVASRAAREYCLLLGTMTSFSSSTAVLEREGLPIALQTVFMLSDRDDLIRPLLAALDYSACGFARICLQTALTAAPLTTRLASTEFLCTLFRSHVPGSDSWLVDLTIGQLYDADTEVVACALGVLDEVCCVPGLLLPVVQRRPALAHLGAAGRQLLLRFCREADGLAYLQSSGFLVSELDRWISGGGCQFYAGQVDVLVSAFMTTYNDYDTMRFGAELKKPTVVNPADGVQREALESERLSLPPHLLGELAHSARGMEVVRELGAVREWVVQLSGLMTAESNTALTLVEAKGVLWSLAHIGASPAGLAFLERLDADIVRHFVDVAERAATLSLRGCVLSMTRLVFAFFGWTLLIRMCG
jgi:hypothetical protein